MERLRLTELPENEQRFTLPKRTFRGWYIPPAAEQLVPGGLLTLLPIEEYEDVIRVCWRFNPKLADFRRVFRRQLVALASSPPAPWERELFWREVEVGGRLIGEALTIQDDVGTPYSVMLRSGGGDARTFTTLTGSTLFSPSLNPVASCLRVEGLGAAFLIPLLGNPKIN